MTDSTVALIAGAAFGVGVVVIAGAVRPRPVSLIDQIRVLNRPGRAMTAPGPGEESGGDRDWRDRLGRSGMRVLAGRGVSESDTVRDRLRVVGKTAERHAFERVLLTLVGFAAPNVLVVILASTGSAASPGYGVVCGLGLGVAGFFYPDVPLAEQAARRRRGFRHALSSYLDLVTIALAGGAGIESSLRGAAESGDGWAFAEIRNALNRAELTGITPWRSFDELGVTLGVDELRELAASVSLAGEFGARVRQSLVAKSDALRAQLAAGIETEAESATERMIGPAIMVLGLTLFIFYGALGAINPAPRLDTLDGQPAAATTVPDDTAAGARTGPRSGSG